MVAEEKGVVTPSGGLGVFPDYSLDDCPPLDSLLVPGGWSVRAKVGNKTHLSWTAEARHHAGQVKDGGTGRTGTGDGIKIETRRVTGGGRSSLDK